MGDDERNRKVEVGKGKLVAYQKKKNCSNEQKKKKKAEGGSEDVDGTECGDSGANVINGSEESESSSLDVSLMEHLQNRVQELERAMEGKEEALKVAVEGLNSSVHVEHEYKGKIDALCTRLIEYQEAVKGRDNVIHQLSASLESTLHARNELAAEGERLVQEVTTLRTQLKATCELVAQGSHKSQHDFMLLQNKMLELEGMTRNQASHIADLQGRLAQKEDEIEKNNSDFVQKSQELVDMKTQAATEVKQLMGEVERLHQEKARAEDREQQLLKQLVELENLRALELTGLRAELEENFGLHLVHIQDRHRLQFTEQLAAMRQHHDEEVTSMRKHYEQELARLATSIDGSEQQGILAVTNDNFREVLNIAETKENIEKAEAYKWRHAAVMWAKQMKTLNVEALKVSCSELEMMISCSAGDQSADSKVIKDKVENLRMLVESLQTQFEKCIEGSRLVIEESDSVTIGLQDKVSVLKETNVAWERKMQSLEESSELSLRDSLEGEVMAESMSEREPQRKCLLKGVVGVLRNEQNVKEVVSELGEKYETEQLEKLSLSVLLETRTEQMDNLVDKLVKVSKELLALREYVQLQKEETLSPDLVVREKAEVIEIDVEYLQRIMSELKTVSAVLCEKIREKEAEWEDHLKADSSCVDKMNAYEMKLGSLRELVVMKSETEEQMKGEMVVKDSTIETLKVRILELQEELSKIGRSKEEQDMMNRQLQQKVEVENKLRKELLEKEEVEGFLKDKLQNVESGLVVMNEEQQNLITQLEEKIRVEEELKRLLLEKEEAGESLRSKLQNVQSDLSTLKESTREAFGFKEQAMSLQKQLQQQLEDEEETVRSYEARVKELTLSLSTLENRLTAEIHDTQMKAQAELDAKREVEQRLIAELESIQGELVSLKASSEVDMYKEQVDALNVMLQEKEKVEEALKREVEAVSIEVTALRELNAELEEQLRMSRVLQEEQLAAASAKVEEVAVLKAKVAELKPFKAEADSLRRELENEKKALEMAQEQLASSQRNTNDFVRDLMLSVKSLQEDKMEYQTKLDQLTRRLDDECQRADENMKLRKVYEEDIAEHKTHIAALNSRLQVVSKSREELLSALSHCRAEHRVQDLELACRQKVEPLQGNSSKEGKMLVETVQEESNSDLESYKQKVENLNQVIAVRDKELSSVRSELEEVKCMRVSQAKELELLNRELKALDTQYKKEGERYRNESQVWKNREEEFVKALNRKSDLISALNDELEKMKFDVSRLQHNVDQVELDRQVHCRDSDVEVHMQRIKVLQERLDYAEAQTQERCLNDGEISNVSLVSQGDLSQLENKLQEALDEKAQLEKSFKNQINRLTESHQKEILLYKDHINMLEGKLAQLAKKPVCVEDNQPASTQIPDAGELMKLLKANLHSEVTKMRAELQSLISMCEPHLEAVFEIHPSTKDDDCFCLDLLTKQTDGSSQSSACVALTHREVSSLRGYIQQLVSRLDELQRKNLDNNAVLAAQRLKENYLEQANEDLRVELGELTTKFLAAQTLAAGKEEAEKSFQKEIDLLYQNCEVFKTENGILMSKLTEMEKTLSVEKREPLEFSESSEKQTDTLQRGKTDCCKICDNLRGECNQLKSELSVVQSALKQVEKERDEYVSRCQSFDEERARFHEEKNQLEKVMKDMLVKTARQNPLNAKESLQECEAALEALQQEYDRLQLEKGGMGNLIESLQAEIKRLQEVEQNYSFHDSDEFNEMIGSLSNDPSNLEDVKINPDDPLQQPLLSLKLMKICSVYKEEKIQLLHHIQELEEVIKSKGERICQLEQYQNEVLTESLKERANVKDTHLLLEQDQLQILMAENEQLCKAVRAARKERVAHLEQADGEEKTLGVTSAERECLLLREQLRVAKEEEELARTRTEASRKAYDLLLEQLGIMRDNVKNMETNLKDAWNKLALQEKERSLLQFQIDQLTVKNDTLEVSLNCSTDYLCKDTTLLDVHKEVDVMAQDLVNEVLNLRRMLSATQQQVQELEMIHEIVKEKDHLQTQQKLLQALQVESGGANEVTSKRMVPKQDDLPLLLTESTEHCGDLEEASNTTVEQHQQRIGELQWDAVKEQEREQSVKSQELQMKLQLLELQLKIRDRAVEVLEHQNKKLKNALEDWKMQTQESETSLQQQCLSLKSNVCSKDKLLRIRELELQHLKANHLLDNKLREVCDIAATSTVKSEDGMEQLKACYEDKIAHLKADFASQLAAMQSAQQEQLSTLLKDLTAARMKMEEMQRFALMKGDTLEEPDLAAANEQYKRELETISSGLEEGQWQLFALLKHRFEGFAHQLLAGTTLHLKREHEFLREHEMKIVHAKHQHELEELQAALDAARLTELSELREELTQRHRNELRLLEQQQQQHYHTETLVASSTDGNVPKVHLHHADSSEAALVHLKHLLYSEYTSTLKELTRAWLPQWQKEVAVLIESLEHELEEESCTVKLQRESPPSALSWDCDGAGSCSSTLTERLDLAEKLSLRAEEVFRTGIAAAERALQTVVERLDAAFCPVAARIHEIETSMQKSSVTVPLEPDVKGTLGAEISCLPKENDMESEGDYRQLVQQLTAEHSAEEGRLRELLAQQEVRRTREMEELRRYFEQKVAELEKHYSEEITSQHSRRVSGSSCDSDSEFTSDVHFASGDIAPPRIPPLTHICETCSSDNGYKELEEKWCAELERRQHESREQMTAMRQQLETRHETEMAELHNQYEEKLQQVARDLVSKQQVIVQRTVACMQDLWCRQLWAVRDSLLAGSETEVLYQAEISDSIREAFHEVHKAYNQALQQQLQAQTEAAVEEVSCSTVETALGKVHLEEKLRREVRKELESELEHQVEQVANIMKINCEHEREIFLQNQSQMLKEFVDQHQHDLLKLKHQHEEELLKLKKQKQSCSDKQVQTNAQQLCDSDKEVQTIAQRLCDSDKEVQTIAQRLCDSDKEVQTFVCQTPPQATSHKEVQTFNPDVSTASQAVQTTFERMVENNTNDSVVTSHSPQLLRAHPVDMSSLVSETSSLPEVKTEPNEFRKILGEVEAAYLKDLQSLLAKWMQGLERVAAGRVSEGDAKSMHEEYLVDLCNKFKCLLNSLEVAHQAETDNLEQTLQQTHGSEKDQCEKLETNAGYEERLRAELEAAKHEVARALEQQIQALLTEDESTPRPQELVQLKRKLSAPYEAQVAALQEQHKQELAALEAASSLAKVSEKSYGERVAENKEFTDAIKERDHWHRVAMALKQLIEELVNYMTECEEEVNNSLIVGDVDQPRDSRTCFMDDHAEESPINEETPKRKRKVHFAPTNLDLKTLVTDEQMLLEYVKEDKDLATKFRAELDTCLEQLRSEAALLIAMTFPRTPGDGNDALYSASGTDCASEESLLQALDAARQRIAELEAERRMVTSRTEVVAEGFGEQPAPGLGMRLQNLSQLQDRARTILGGRPVSPQDPPQLQLLDELCREGDRLVEEARREREDLRLQVESADKQLRSTRQFLEEQAAEREQERDEFQQELVQLQEQLKAKDKELAEQQRLAREVEALEQQGREAVARHQELEAQRELLQTEVKAAVDKVWLLRDVVAELELQAEAKDLRAGQLEAHIQELQRALEEQTSNQQHLSEELESLRAEGGSELSRQVAALQEQLQAHRLQAELYRPAALQQMKAQIRELEANVERRTRQLEGLHAASSNQSSPSEDVSIREHLESFRCDTPEEMRASIFSLAPDLGDSPGSSPRLVPPPSPLPLKDLARLQERLQRHARAEEAALKRTRDLEMQLRASRRAEEEASAERDVLQERVAEQMLKIASLEACVDASRHKVASEMNEVAQELQEQLRDSEEAVQKLQQELEHANSEFQKCEATLVEVKDHAEMREKELLEQLQIEKEAADLARKQSQDIAAEWEMAQKSYQPCSGVGRFIPLPVLFETLLADKNAEIDSLRARLADGGAASRGDQVVLASPVATSTTGVEDGNLLEQLSQEQARVKSLENTVRERPCECSRDLLSQIRAKTEMIKLLQQQVTKLQEQSAALKQEHESLRPQVTSLQAEASRNLEMALKAQATEATLRLQVANLETRLDEEHRTSDAHARTAQCLRRRLSECKPARNQSSPCATSDQTGLDELAGAVVRELEESAQLDTSLLERLSSAEEDGAWTCSDFGDDPSLAPGVATTRGADSHRQMALPVHLPLSDSSASSSTGRDGVVVPRSTSAGGPTDGLPSSGASPSRASPPPPPRSSPRVFPLARVRSYTDLVQSSSLWVPFGSSPLPPTPRARPSPATSRSPLPPSLAWQMSSLPPAPDPARPKSAPPPDSKRLESPPPPGAEGNKSPPSSAKHQKLPPSPRVEHPTAPPPPSDERPKPPPPPSAKRPRPPPRPSTEIPKSPRRGPPLMTYPKSSTSGSILVYLAPELADPLPPSGPTSSTAGATAGETGGASPPVTGSDRETIDAEEAERALLIEQTAALDLKSQMTSQSSSQADLRAELERMNRQRVEAQLELETTRLTLEEERIRVLSLESNLQQQNLSIDQLRQMLDTERGRTLQVQEDHAQLLETVWLRLQPPIERPSESEQDGQVEPVPEDGIQPKEESKTDQKGNMAHIKTDAVQAAAMEAAAAAVARAEAAEEAVRAIRRRLTREQETVRQLRSDTALLQTRLTTAETQAAEAYAAAERKCCEAIQEQLHTYAQQSAADAMRLTKERLEAHLTGREAELVTQRLAAEEAKAETKELRVQVQDLQAELYQVRTHCSALQDEGHHLKRELQELQRLPTPPATDAKLVEPFQQKIKDMNESLDQQVRDHSKVALTLARLVEERRNLLLQVEALSKELEQFRVSETAAKEALQKAEETTKRLAAEKAVLQEELIQLRLIYARREEEAANRAQDNASSVDMEERVNHLFGRYLRAESYRKALAWQKKYLLVVIEGCQHTLNIHHLVQTHHMDSAHQNSEPATEPATGRMLARFRSAAIVIVAIQRMHFLVRRWRRGRQIGGCTVLNRAYSDTLYSDRLSSQGNRLGTASSGSGSCWSMPVRATPISPPSRDRSAPPSGTGWERPWRTAEVPVPVPPLHVGSYVDRYDELHQRLGLAVGRTRSSQ